jgi:hydrogenase maturation protein HypF
MQASGGQASAARTRRAIRVHGAVQGVGFRPAVYRMARGARLAGFVRNDSEGVWIEVEGDGDALARFTDAIVRDAPPLARIAGIEVVELAPRGEHEFVVLGSAAGALTRAIVPADAATCDACLWELLDPRDRRHRYPFINCTDCGPRFTIVRDIPYDRVKTTMDVFFMCRRCRAEYEDPSNRRFHAEANACPECGPRVALIERGRRIAEGDEAIVAAVERLGAGAIVAVKGLGGYQLAVDAADDAAVRRLRDRKRRPHKPFAIMAPDLGAVAAIAEVDDVARDALRSPARPIVLLPALSRAVASSVAPALRDVGVMLPTTPLHHLLFDGGPPLLVMTSGNLAEEPIARDDDEALATLGGVADAFLVHDRPIHTRADDSVVRVVAGGAQPVRRARGFVPDAIALRDDGPSVLAVGPQLKSTVCLTRGAEAYLSQHVGDLDGVEAQAFFEEVVDKLTTLLGVQPVAVAHDLHPDYASTRWALRSPLRRIPVQHHHAHVVSCMAEHGHTGPAIGVAFDGTGCGPAGELWGGEFLLADLARFRRLGHLRPLPLPGGEAAIREPWRLAVAALHDADEDVSLVSRVDATRRESIVHMLERSVACPPATGAGRWFDAMAAIVGARDAITYEGQAAVELEALAWLDPAPRGYPFSIDAPPDAPFVVDLRPTVRAAAADVRRGQRPSRIAARFHATLAEIVLEACRRARRDHGTATAALSGGCFQNRWLTERATELLAADGFDVLVHRRVPPNDGGLALGQAAIAAHRLRRERELGADACEIGEA